MKKALHKSNWREILQSKTRFLSILGIIFLGVAFFVGLSSTGPDMLQTADHYFKTKRLADANVTSTMGMTQTDLNSIKQLPQVETAQANYYKDISLTAKNQVVRFFGYTSSQSLNRYQVVTGRLPQKQNEIALDELAARHHYYKIGDAFKIEKADDNDLAEHSFKVVGFVNNPHYIENVSRGNTKVGKGSIDYFAVISQKNFPQTIFPEVLVAYKKDDQAAAYTKAYDEQVARDQKKLVKATSADPKKRLEKVKAAGQKQIDEAQQQLDAAKEKQAQAIEQAKAEGTKTLNDAKAKLDQAKTELATGQAEYQAKDDAAKKQVSERQQLIDEQKKQLAEQQQEKNQKTADWEKKQQLQKQLSEQQAQSTTAKSQLEQAKQVQEKLQSLTDQTKDSETLDHDKINSELDSLQAPLADASLSSIKTGVDQLKQVQAATDFKQQLSSLLDQTKQSVSSSEQQEKRTNEQAEETQKQLAELPVEQSDLDQLEQAITQTNQTIQTANDQLTTAKADLTKSQNQGQDQLKSAQTKIDQAQSAYEEGQKNLEQQTKIQNPVDTAGITAKINQQKIALEQMQPGRYIYQTRKDNPGYLEYKDNAKRISSLATIFPIIFFLIAALVTLTTMARMIEEKRTEIGTLKALGYKNHEIAQKYLLYAALAGGIGTILGLFIGVYLFPKLIFNAYGQMYNLTDLISEWHWPYILLAIGVALLCTVGVVLIVLRLSLRATPATLMRPKAPKNGKRIFLERITPLWRNLSFMQKVTLRNLFRYKQRMLMTILGIAGCMSMLITGFGLRDSIGDIVAVQFDKLWHYQATTTFSEPLSEKQYADYEKKLADQPNYRDNLRVASESFSVSKAGHKTQEVSVYAPEDARKFKEFVLLNDRKTGQVYRLNSQGVVISEKLAKLLALKRGDGLPLKDASGVTHNVRIENIVENYVGHYVYLNAAYYQEIFGSEPNYNADLLLFSQQPDKKSENKIADSLMQTPQVVNVSFLSKSRDALKDTIKSLTVIIWVLIVSAGLLAFIVLYNLTNINVSERIRELSTIKVLGFYDSEVVAYVYRENIMLTIIGIILGLFLGKLEHRYVLNTVEVDLTMFSPEIHPLSYLYASLITLLFALIVGIIMYFKLKKINMIEALKENE